VGLPLNPSAMKDLPLRLIRPTLDKVHGRGSRGVFSFFFLTFFVCLCFRFSLFFMFLFPLLRASGLRSSLLVRTSVV